MPLIPFEPSMINSIEEVIVAVILILCLLAVHKIKPSV